MINPKIRIWGIDTYGSVFKKYHETGVFDKKEIYPYTTEGIGEDILPENVDFSVHETSSFSKKVSTRCHWPRNVSILIKLDFKS